VDNWSVESKTLAGFIGAAIVLLLVILGVMVTMQTFIVSSRWVWRATEMSSTRERVYSSLIDTVSSTRTFASTGAELYLQSRDAARDRLHSNLQTLSAQVPADMLVLQQRVRDLDHIIEHLLQTLDASLHTQTERREDRTAAQLSAQIHDDLTTIRDILDSLDHAQADHLARRLEADDHAAALLYVWLALIAVVMFSALAWLSRRIAADLRRRQEVETRLQETNGFLESLLENIPTMVFAKDAEQLRFMRLNQAGEKLLGRSRTEILGKSDREFFPPEQASFFINKDREVLAQGDIVDIPEEEIDTIGQGRRVLHTRKVPIMDAAGRPRFLLGISMDITREKATQRDVLALNEELRRHTELLESSNRELESFCYSVSHDLRAPLRAINGFTRLLEQEHSGRLEGEAPRYLRTICNASERMGRLIDDLLEFSRIGRQVLEHELIDMRNVVKNVIDDVVAGRDQPLPQINIGNLPPIRGDRRLLHLVWLNLLDNAVKYSAAAERPSITIDAEHDAQEVVYCIRDNGVGFDMRYYDKLFGVFQRLHSDATYPGTGVGLAISQRIVARHGGRIWARSEPGKGAQFYFSLPLNKELSAVH
jgi:PAS domain S-box-containing protein